MLLYLHLYLLANASYSLTIIPWPGKIQRLYHMANELNTRITLVSGSDMDVRFPESPAEARMQQRTIKLLDLFQIQGVFQHTYRQAIEETERGSHETLGDIHGMCALLYSDWRHAKSGRDEARAVADARIFNRLTQAARKVRVLNHLQDNPMQPLIEELGARSDLEGSSVNRDGIATSLYAVARAMTHRNTWMDMVLPSRQNQPYSAILVASIEPKDMRSRPAVVTKTVVANTGMFAHHHAVCDAYETPLGSSNQVTNAIVVPRSNQSAFPLRVVRRDTFDERSVGCIPAGHMHILTPDPSFIRTDFLSLEQIYQEQRGREVINGADFGLHASLHIYVPNADMARRFQRKLTMDEASQIATIVFDTYNRTIYVGDLHAMERRTAYWQRGECCGLCLRPIAETEDSAPISFDTIRELIASSEEAQHLPLWREDPETGKLKQVEK